MTAQHKDHQRQDHHRAGRIAARFAALKAQGKAAMIPYLQAYDPDLDTSRALLAGLPAAGADLIELGVPFTDPAADGPAIQRAGLRALKAGATLAGVLEMVRGFRAAEDAVPVVLMGYLNPILAYGAERFCADAAAAGVDGLIVVDMPPEEADELAPFATAQGLDLIRLIAPTTDDARLPYALDGAGGFVYHVSITGITGTRSAAAEELRRNVGRIRAATALPIGIGFGIRTPEQAAEAARVADAAVVGTALVETLASTLDSEGRAGPETVRRVHDHVRALAEAVHEARVPA
ncbi:tryptophan synthase subunit alpha [Roseomonas gilardii]|uniref:Tryptophan synthase alpha chain n=1 Tax=Roseomonas gilardii TaxID=257708 RepID=A0A1L7AJD8_9PROT|nr:tryptophan synthase subunit alpha [Roseomonas gilardii]APT58895.1 tryptophan synthase subunit alpha [Roseomonas gilardii]MDT8332163.1 tryptophan synthase subunit alpha [Roseomonas gilardii]